MYDTMVRGMKIAPEKFLDVIKDVGYSKGKMLDIYDVINAFALHPTILKEDPRRPSDKEKNWKDIKIEESSREAHARRLLRNAIQVAQKLPRLNYRSK